MLSAVGQVGQGNGHSMSSPSSLWVHLWSKSSQQFNIITRLSKSIARAKKSRVKGETPRTRTSKSQIKA